MSENLPGKLFRRKTYERSIGKANNIRLRPGMYIWETRVTVLPQMMGILYFVEIIDNSYHESHA